MPASQNGGEISATLTVGAGVTLADASVTEWRKAYDAYTAAVGGVTLADASVTEWRAAEKELRAARAK